jgi:hypothetical protein
MSVTGVSAGAISSAGHAKAAAAQVPSGRNKSVQPPQHHHHAGGSKGAGRLTAGKLTSAGNTPVLDTLV